MIRNKIKKIEKGAIVLTVILFIIALSNLTFAETSFSSSSLFSSSFSFSNTQFYQPSFNQYYSSQEIGTYWPILLNKTQCTSRQDLIIQIPPGGCSPAVVRSDLLEEQNVAVFCQLSALNLNPLADVKSIDDVAIAQRNGSDEISGVGFYPYRAALNTQDRLLGSPLMNNIGYAVVVLKKQPVEKNMSDWVTANLSARIIYNLENMPGIGKGEFILPILSDNDWQRDYQEYGFWNGKAYVRVNSIEKDKASFSIYKDAYQRVSNAVVEKGKTSDTIYFPGFYCQAGVQLMLEDVIFPAVSAKLSVGNDIVEVYENSKILDTGCTVNSIEDNGLGGRVAVSCSGRTYYLQITSKKVGIKVEDEAESTFYSVGDNITIPPNPNVAQTQMFYLAYAGERPQSLQPTNSNEKQYFIVIIKTDKNQQQFYDSGIMKRISDFVRKYNDNDLNKLKSGIKETVTKSSWLGISASDDTLFLLQGEADNFKATDGRIATSPKFNFTEFEGTIDKDYNNEGKNGTSFMKYFSSAVNASENLTRRFPNENDASGQEYFGARSLSATAALAGDSQMKQTQKNLLDEIISVYPDTKAAENAKINLAKLEEFSTERASVTVQVQIGVQKTWQTINLLGVKSPGIDEIGVKISFTPRQTSTNVATQQPQTTSQYYFPGEYIFHDFTSDNKEEYINFTQITEDENGNYKVVFGYKYMITETDNNGAQKQVEKTGKLELKRGERAFQDGFLIYIEELNVKKVAKVILTPNVQGAELEANFTFKIGIEKRAIKLSVEKTKEMIANINDTINKVEGIVNNLDKFVKGMKGACIATSTALVVKNFIENLGGAGIARDKIMRGDGGWIQKCTQMIAEKLYKNQDECLSKNSDKINADVDAMARAIEAYNERASQLEQGISQTNFLGETSVNTSAYVQRAINDLHTSNIPDIGKIGPNNKTAGKIISELDYNSFNNGQVSLEDLQAINVNTRIINDNSIAEDSVAKQKAKADLQNRLKNIESLKSASKSQEDFAKTLGIDSNQVSFIIKDKAKEVPYNGLTWANVKSSSSVASSITGISDGDPIAVIKDNDNKEYIYVLSKQGSDYAVAKTFVNQSGKWTLTKNQYNLYFTGSTTSYKNLYKNAKVRYFETEPYKGLPAIVPFDLTNGWYAALKQNLPVFGQVQSYEASGQVSSFYLCNVGANGLEQFNEGFGDDICQMINLDTGQPLGQFSGLSETESREKVNQAIQAIKEAANQYGKKGTIRIRGQDITLGEPATNTPGTQCQDFMSPGDCSLLFNVCDPVICPASRCNLGGSYYVSDVVQSGIIGSIALCLPNFGNPANGGVLIPVCLTGIEAGLNAYLSILNSTRACLQESLDTGRNVGICDEIKSIYLCEFFWRQLAPLVNVLIPKLIELAYGQGTRGGGEYLTVMDAWQSMEKSVNYIENNYAANAYKAFQLRSTEEAGAEVCKSFISTKFANFNAMLEPESPPQFYAWFDEIPYTTATLPATSQYKVYYHIYAGKDSGAPYSVYLSNPPESGFYSQNPTVVVVSGYIGRGQSLDETKDFTAPSGYKKLCVSINTQDYCGFGQVSTSFALDYINEKYIQEQASQTQITSEKDCVQGTPSLYPLLQPNAEAGVQESLFPEIYNAGVIRICSTDKPGLSSDDSSRWTDVGYCDDEKVRCWLDTQSVKNNLKNTGIANETLSEVQTQDFNKLLQQGLIDDRQKVDDKIKETNNPSDILNFLKDNNAELTAKTDSMVVDLSGTLNRTYYSDQKARILFRISEIYTATSRIFWDKLKQQIDAEAQEAPQAQEEKKKVEQQQQGAQGGAAGGGTTEEKAGAGQGTQGQGTAGGSSTTGAEGDTSAGKQAEGEQGTAESTGEKKQQIEEINIPADILKYGVKVGDTIIINVKHSCSRVMYEVVQQNSVSLPILGDIDFLAKDKTYGNGGEVGNNGEIKLELDKEGKFYIYAKCFNENGLQVGYKNSGIINAVLGFCKKYSQITSSGCICGSTKYYSGYCCDNVHIDSNDACDAAAALKYDSSILAIEENAHTTISIGDIKNVEIWPVISDAVGELNFDIKNNGDVPLKNIPLWLHIGGQTTKLTSGEDTGSLNFPNIINPSGKKPQKYWFSLPNIEGQWKGIQIGVSGGNWIYAGQLDIYKKENLQNGAAVQGQEGGYVIFDRGDKGMYRVQITLFSLNTQTELLGNSYNKVYFGVGGSTDKGKSYTQLDIGNMYGPTWETTPENYVYLYNNDLGGARHPCFKANTNKIGNPPGGNGPWWVIFCLDNASPHPLGYATYPDGLKVIYLTAQDG
jgi:hypothetical protein